MARKSNKHNKGPSHSHANGDRKRKAEHTLSTPAGSAKHHKTQHVKEAELQHGALKNDLRQDKTAEESNIQEQHERPPRREPGQLRTPPPEVPNALDPKALLIPPEAEDAEIRRTWEIDAIAVTKNSSIRGTVVRARAALRVDEPPAASISVSSSSVPAVASTLTPLAKSPKKRTILALMARAPYANTCISIAEILKRELCDGPAGRGVWQYTGSWRRLEIQPSNSKGSRADSKATGESHLSEDDRHFDVLQEVERTKVRNVSCLVIYLTLEHVPRLKAIYGEQKTSAKPT